MTKPIQAVSRSEKVLRVFVPLSLAYFLSYTYRNSNAVLAGEFTSELNIRATELGLLTSAYFLSFAIFQFPLGFLLDRFGTRRVEGTLVLTASVGSALFAFSHNVESLFIARALIGLGVSACLMGALRALSSVYTESKWPMINGLFLAFGSAGAFFATTPLNIVSDAFGWREVFIGLSALTFCVAVVIFTFMPRNFETLDDSNWRTQFSGLSKILKSRNFLAVTPVAAFVQAINLTWLSLWGGPWLTDVAHLNKADVSQTLSICVLGLIFGYLILGITTKWLGRIGMTPMVITKAVCLLIIVFYARLAFGSVPNNLAVWFLFGALSGSTMLVYSSLQAEFPSHMAGRVITLLNFAVFIMAFMCQAGFGVIIDHFSIDIQNGFSPTGYGAALLLWVALMAFSLLWMHLRYLSPEYKNEPFIKS